MGCACGVSCSAWENSRAVRFASRTRRTPGRLVSALLLSPPCEVTVDTLLLYLQPLVFAAFSPSGLNSGLNLETRI